SSFALRISAEPPPRWQSRRAERACTGPGRHAVPLRPTSTGSRAQSIPAGRRRFLPPWSVRNILRATRSREISFGRESRSWSFRQPELSDFTTRFRLACTERDLHVSRFLGRN